MFRYVPFVIVVLWAVFALFGPLLPLTPDAINLPKILHTPDSGAWLGYDDLGRPIWDRLVMGAQTSFIVALWVTVISVCIGTFIGASSAYFGGTLDLICPTSISTLISMWINRTGTAGPK